MKSLKYWGAVFLVGTGLYGFESFVQWEDPTFGGLKPIPEYSEGQKTILALLQKETERLHKDLEQKLNFLSQNKEIVDGKFVRSFQAREQYTYPVKDRFIVNHRVIIDVKGGGNEYTIEAVEFFTRRSRTNKNYEHPHTQIMRINHGPGAEWEKLKISIKKLNPYGEQKDALELKDIYDPGLRVLLAKTYKNRLTELVNDLEMQIAGVGLERDNRIHFIRREMDTSSGSRQH